MHQPGLMRYKVIVAALVVALLAGACSNADPKADRPTTTSPPTSAPEAAAARSGLAAAATQADVRVGAAVDAGRLRSEPEYREAIVNHFTSMTPENAMKWTSLRPERDRWDWEDADAIVDFADEHDLEVRGHTLVWGQDAGNGMPAWLTELNDPAEFRRAVTDGITTQLTRYRGRVQRWDVVNEPLEGLGGALDRNPFYQRIGPNYIEEVFRIADAADPDAELWLNEYGTEFLPAKGEQLVQLVTDLVNAGVPIDGVGFQSHVILDVDSAPETQRDVMARIRALGLEVAITELDVPISATRDEAEQIDVYRRMTEACLAQKCAEITVWGVDDDSTWLDVEAIRASNPLLGALSLPSDPLLLGPEFEEKRTYDAVASALRGP